MIVRTIPAGAGIPSFSSAAWSSSASAEPWAPGRTGSEMTTGGEGFGYYLKWRESDHCGCGGFIYLFILLSDKPPGED